MGKEGGGVLAPSGVFLCNAKLSVDELFMHYFHMSALPPDLHWGFIPGNSLGDFCPHADSNLPTPEKISAGAHYQSPTTRIRLARFYDNVLSVIKYTATKCASLCLAFPVLLPLANHTTSISSATGHSYGKIEKVNFQSFSSNLGPTKPPAALWHLRRYTRARQGQTT